ncbi:glycosyltransferase family 2 protein, partial [Lactobacillus delbrueckii subsp. bulgaricus]
MYYYRQRGGSITHTSSAVNYDAMYASQEVYDFVKKRQPEYTAEANFAYVFSRIGVIDNLTVQPTVDKQKIRKIRNDMKANIKQLKKTDCFSKLS